jgi:hypothetical protein
MQVSLNQPLSVLVRKAANYAFRRAHQLTPAELLRQRRHTLARKSVERRFAKVARNHEPRFTGRVLLDGMYDNPNYWLRLSLFRSALGLANADEVGLLGPHNSRRSATTFSALGVDATIDLVAAERGLGSYRSRARTLLAATSDPAEILEWDLPYGVPALYLYDALLRRQQAVMVDLNHHKIELHVADALRSMQAAGDVVARGEFDLIVLSHHFDTRYSALTFAAIARGIPVYVLYGNMGHSKFVRFDCIEDTLRFIDSPSGQVLDRIPEEKAAALRHIGERYLTEYRWAGRTQDLGAIYAFQGSKRGVMSRNDLVARFKWDAARPIVAVYLGNGWDNIHGMGMRNFRDLEDWLQTTLETAKCTDAVNWLFRGHPIDRMYQGVNLQDRIPVDIPPHVRVCDTAWNNSDILASADAVVTYHGTAGVEFAAMGKPALLADRGWYHDCGIAKWSKSREEFLTNLSSNWWRDMDLDANRKRALLFAGLFFCTPEWRKSLIQGDDSRRQSLYSEIATLLETNPDAFEREVESIWQWFQAGAAGFHTWTMLSAENYALSNVKR